MVARTPKPCICYVTYLLVQYLSVAYYPDMLYNGLAIISTLL
jgi:hypothetical protein